MRRALKLAIVNSGFSQFQIARFTGLADSRLSKIVNGWAEPSAEERTELARVLNQPEELLFDPDAAFEIRSAR